MKTISIFSGGMDSATLVAYLMDREDEVKCLTFDYGQRHKKEIESAAELCKLWGLEHRVVDLSCIQPLICNSSQTGEVDVPHGHYEEENMKLTVVPNRNMIMLSIAIGWAVNEGYERVAYGAHSGDHAIYPDCRTEFVSAMRTAASLCDWRAVTVFAPFLNLHKGEIAWIGIELDVPFNLTWTCYEGKDDPCGQCGACQERREAFAYAEKV